MRVVVMKERGRSPLSRILFLLVVASFSLPPTPPSTGEMWIKNKKKKKRKGKGGRKRNKINKCTSATPVLYYSGLTSRGGDGDVGGPGRSASDPHPGSGAARANLECSGRHLSVTRDGPVVASM